MASSRGCLRVPLGQGKPVNLWAKPDLPVLVDVRLEKAPKLIHHERRVKLTGAFCYAKTEAVRPPLSMGRIFGCI